MKDKLPTINDLDDLSKVLDIQKKYIIDCIYNVPYDKRYKSFEIPKRKGGKREISAPINKLKLIQKNLNEILTNYYENFITSQVHGFCHNRSIVTNAKHHLNKKFVLNIDLKDFFPSIHFGRVKGLFKSEPFNFNDNISNILANICCHQGVLPQGAPTSPIITNFICKKMDKQLHQLAKMNKCKYTRYADDITISTVENNFPEEIALIKKCTDETINKFNNLFPKLNAISKIKDFKFINDFENSRDEIKIILENRMDKEIQKQIKDLIFTNGARVTFQNEKEIELKSNNANPEVMLGDKLIKIIEDNGFQLNYNKVRMSTRNYKQEVTGVKVNEKLNVERTYIRNIRAMLYCWETEGIEKAQSKVKDKATNFNHPNKKATNFRNILWGRIDFVGQVRGKDDKIYQKFIEKYIKLENGNVDKIKPEINQTQVILTNLKNLDETVETLKDDVYKIKEIVKFDVKPSFDFSKICDTSLSKYLEGLNKKMIRNKFSKDYPEFSKNYIIQIESIINNVVEFLKIDKCYQMILNYRKDFLSEVQINKSKFQESFDVKNLTIKDITFNEKLFITFAYLFGDLEKNLKYNYYFPIFNHYQIRNTNCHATNTNNSLNDRCKDLIKKQEYDKYICLLNDIYEIYLKKLKP